MGKRSKNVPKGSKEDGSIDETNLGVCNLTSKRKRSVDEVLETRAHTDDKSKKKKRKKCKVTSEAEQSGENRNTSSYTESKYSKPERNQIASEPTFETEGKKLAFADDTPQEVQIQISNNKKSKKKKKQNTQNINEAEEEVDDGDIDKFCDELSEQDNEQYEEWIKLLAAKLRPNKKT